MIELNKTIEYLEKVFDKANEKWYNSELERPVIAIQSSGKKNSYGWCSNKRIWKTDSSNNGSKDQYEITICAEYLTRDKYGIYGTLLHEMVHLYNAIHEVKDTTNNFIYHNKRFKNEAEQRGLIIEHDKKLGWSITTLSEEAKEYFDSTLEFDSNLFAFSRSKASKIISENKYKLYNYECNCGQKIKSLQYIGGGRFRYSV